MLSDHFAPGLLAHEKMLPKGAFLYFLIASQLQDLLWLVFHYLGLEATIPSDALIVTLQSITVDMLYSHDLYPQIDWLLLFGIPEFAIPVNTTIPVHLLTYGGLVIYLNHLVTKITYSKQLN
ncbi:hypothetical protein [Leptospira sp. GIMC2001]|uniref:hypothetical protein n=1 Tax=Leptospira sp. GIMC2001 TaxID=1513297 RepID=UPI00234988CD|nr:hypothetical protein [Leptospira sp. GIMC2001]WCL49920.1 hypothetical protein O4O04_03630 [Leptospira sp. GIMC2001]